MSDVKDRSELAQIEEDANGGVTVNLDGKTGEGGERRQPPKEEHRGDENVEALKSQLARERQARIDAQNHSQQLDTRRRQAESQSVSGQLTLLEQSISATTNERTSLKNEYTAALQAGEFDKASDINDKMIEAATRISNMVAGRDQLKQRVEQERANGGRVEQQPQRRVNADPVEAFIEQSGVSNRSADWLRDHPECVTDPRKQRQTARAHEDAVYEGIQPDTKAYFDFIEEKMGYRDERREDRRDVRDGRGSDRNRDAVSGVAAPPSRGGADGRGAQGGNKVYLSAIEKETAEELKMSYADYARHKQALQKEGKLR